MNWSLLGKMALGFAWAGFVIWLVHSVIARRLYGDSE